MYKFRVAFVLALTCLGASAARSETVWTISSNGMPLADMRVGIETVKEDINGTGWACLFNVVPGDTREIDIACSTNGLTTAVFFKKRCDDQSKMLLLADRVGATDPKSARLEFRCQDVQAPDTPNHEVTAENFAQNKPLNKLMYLYR